MKKRPSVHHQTQNGYIDAWVSILVLLIVCVSPTGAAAQDGNPGRLVVTYSNGLVMLNTDGTNIVNLTENAAQHQAPYPSFMIGSDDWSPSVSMGGTVAFQSVHDTSDGTHGTGSRIYVVGPSGIISQLTTTAGLHIDSSSGMYPNDVWPVISQDGSKVCFIGARNELETSPGVFSHPWRDLYVVNTDGTGLHQVTASQSKAGSGANYSWVQACAWNPDGSTIAFKGLRLRTDPDGQQRFHVVLGTINPDGSGETHLPVIDHSSWLDSSGWPSEQALDWSPDGRYLLVAYGGGAMGAPYPRYIVVDLAPGGSVAEITPPGSMFAGTVRFSPDSQRIVYLTDNPGFTAAYPTFINRDGTNKIVLNTVEVIRYVPVWWMPGPPVPVPSRLELTPNPVKVFQEGAEVHVTPTLYDAQGDVIVHGARTWTIDPYYLGSPAVSNTGAVVDRGTTVLGTFVLTATNAGLRATTQVIVKPPSPAITLNPDSLDFSTVPAGASVTQATTVGNPGSRDLVVAAIALCTGTSGEFTWSQAVPFTVSPGSHMTLSITYAPSDSGIDNGCMHIASNDPESPSATLSVTGAGTVPPTLSLVPSSLGFGTVVVGTSRTMWAQIRNPGSFELMISGIGRCQGTGSEFAWSPPAPLVVGPGGTLDLSVTYSPSDVGSDGGCLSIVSNDPTNPTRALNLGGAGSGPGDSRASGDFDGDGKSDFVVYRPTTGEWFIRYSSYGYVVGAGAWWFQWGLIGDVPIVGDFDGDGRTDVTVYRPTTGEWFIRYSSYGYVVGAGTWLYQWGLPGDTPIASDFDGDGKTDVAVYRPSTGEWFIRYSSRGYLVGAGTWLYQWGLPGDMPISADFDGDGKTDLAVYRPTTGEWFIRYSSRGHLVGDGPWLYQWGLAGDTPIAADFDGDGKTDLGVYRPSTGQWFIRYSTHGHAVGAGAWLYQWGLVGDVPMVEDFDGDGKTDITVYRPATGEWFLRNSSYDYVVGAGAWLFQWGLVGDTPLP